MTHPNISFAQFCLLCGISLNFIDFRDEMALKKIFLKNINVFLYVLRLISPLWLRTKLDEPPFYVPFGIRGSSRDSQFEDHKKK